MSKIVAYLKDRWGKKYKIEEVKQGNLLWDSSYWYNVLTESNSVLYKNFKSKSSAIKYLEEHKGPCNSY
jgi:hypothetical protein